MASPFYFYCSYGVVAATKKPVDMSQKVLSMEKKVRKQAESLHASLGD